MKKHGEIVYYTLELLEKRGKNIEGSVLHVGCADDRFLYKCFFPKADRYHTLDIRGEFNPDIIADVQNMPEVDSDSEDCIIATFMLYQVPDTRAALREFQRVLKPGGMLIVSFTHTRGAYRIKKFTHAEALQFSEEFFTIEHAEKEDIGTMIVAINDKKAETVADSGYCC